jgi:hypothetical protein
LVFLPITLKNNVPQLFSGKSVESVVPFLKTCAFSISAQKMELDAEPEEGKFKALSHIYDQFQLAEKRAELAEKYALRIAQEAKEKMEILTVSDSSDIHAKQKEIKETLEIREKALSARKRAYREKEKLKTVEDEAKSIGISMEE